MAISKGRSPISLIQFYLQRPLQDSVARFIQGAGDTNGQLVSGLTKCGSQNLRMCMILQQTNIALQVTREVEVDYKSCSQLQGQVQHALLLIKNEGQGIENQAGSICNPLTSNLGQALQLCVFCRKTWILAKQMVPKFKENHLECPWGNAKGQVRRVLLGLEANVAKIWQSPRALQAKPRFPNEVRISGHLFSRFPRARHICGNQAHLPTTWEAAKGN